ncbi:HLA class II histocompatibility antigen, DM beta chain [Sceloporus undulatus]|uniref:HLA class II histocompatibility antigen, DM beta chain n=1 Tax=Sceloporus undulatus TaxID=8520 RepID=UPI001C4A83CA|nr:HLA class II histocompatibility antigen, DM beta chain [Sceloporus undulatus]
MGVFSPWWPLALGALWPAGAFVLQLETDCFLSDTGQVFWTNWMLTFNRIPFICYDNDYLPCGLGTIDPWRQVSSQLSQQLNATGPPQGPAACQACQGQTQSLWGRTAERRTPPNVLIFPVTPRNTPSPIMLACGAWGFYPPEVNITWFWNGAQLKDKMGALTLNNNGDWTYQARRTLPVDPKTGGIYTCKVDHVSLAEPIAKQWAPGLPLDLRLKVGLAVMVLAVGTVFLTVATIFWRRKWAPQGYVPIDGSTYPEGH